MIYADSDSSCNLNAYEALAADLRLPGLWQFGRLKQRLGGCASVSAAEDRRKHCQHDARSGLPVHSLDPGSPVLQGLIRVQPVPAGQHGR